MWSHLAMFIMQLTVMYLKKFEYRQIAQILQWTVFFGCYFLWYVRVFYLHKLIFGAYYYDEGSEEKEQETVRWTQTNCWLEIELKYFMANVVGLMLFIFYAYMLKF